VLYPLFFKCCDVRGSVWLSWVVSYVDSSLFCFIPVALYVQCPLFCSLGSVLFSWVASYVDSPLFVKKQLSGARQEFGEHYVPGAPRVKLVVYLLVIQLQKSDV
jgi:hypothetical protein